MTTTIADSAVRGMTDDGSLRVVTVRTTDTVREIVNILRPNRTTTEQLSQMITGTVLVRETMAPQLRVQGILRSRDGGTQIVADAWPDGGNRALVQIRKNQPDAPFIEGATLQMMRSMPNGSLHRGVVSVPSPGGISGALMAYMQESEQVVSMIAVGTLMEGDRLVASGGYIVQLLPELSEGVLMVMTERLKEFQSIEELIHGEFTPDALLAELFYAMPYTRLAESPVNYQCRCDAVRLMTSLATLPRADIMEMIKDGKTLEIQCDYCTQEYKIDPESLRGLLSAS